MLEHDTQRLSSAAQLCCVRWNDWLGGDCVFCRPNPRNSCCTLNDDLDVILQDEAFYGLNLTFVIDVDVDDDFGVRHRVS